MTSPSKSDAAVPWARTRFERVVLTIVAVALAVVVTFLAWSLIDADSRPAELALAAAIGAAVVSLNAFARLVILLRNPDAFR